MRSFVACLCAALVIPVAALAHHSASQFNHDKLLETDAVVKEWHWTNPHCWLLVDAADASGKPVQMGLELGSPNTLFRFGWRFDTLKPGDHVKINYMPRFDGKPGGQLYAALPPGHSTYMYWLPRGVH